LVGHWCYQSQKCELPQCEGPAQWHQTYKDCKGSRQSPVNIVTRNVVYEKSLKPLSFEGYDVKGSAKWNLENNGHTGKYCPACSWGLGLHTAFGSHSREVPVTAKAGRSHHSVTSPVASARAFPVSFKEPSGSKPERGSTGWVGSTTPRVVRADLTSCFVLQLSQFAALHFGGKNSTPMMENFRPAQPLNERKVLWSGASIALSTAQLLLLALALTCTLSSL
ncbi:CAH15 anhydrase, partial [Pheucticus melanocephalus]|nr:CAH15 anhydrase [Pheucticus melanocephalus]